MKFNKKVVITVITMIVTYTTAVLYIFYHTSSEPTALTTVFFGFAGGELWLLKEIKVNENEETHQSKRKKTKATDK